MAFDLPNSPIAGDTYALGGKTWQYDGTAWTGISALSPGMVVKVFTSSGTWTPSAGMRFAQIECVGSGGGGGAVDGSGTHILFAAGGGSGGYSRTLVTAAQAGASQTVTVSNGGAGGVAGPNAGSAGAGDTSVGTLCVAKPGQGGGHSSTTAIGAAGAGGVAGTGDFTAAGSSGNAGTFSATTTVVPSSAGGGGSSIFGGGGKPVAWAATASAVGTAAGTYGGGGSGAYASESTTDRAGGDGSKGIAIITEYIAAGGAGIASTDNAVARYDGTAGLLQNSAVTIDDTGHITFAGNLVFPATQAASAGANTLDDYEEGTWTPTIQFGDLSTSVAYAAQVGVYTKIGRLVQVSVDLTLTNNGTGTGRCDIEGVPFTAASGEGDDHMNLAVITGGSSISGIFGQFGDTTIFVRQQAATAIADANQTNITDSARLRGSGAFSIV